MKKIFFIIFVLMVCFGFVIPNQVWAEEKCECSLKVESLSCKVNDKVILDFGTHKIAELVIKKLPNSKSCKLAVAGPLGTLIKDSEITITKESCSNIKKFKKLLSSSYTLNCSLVGSAQNTKANTTPSVKSNPTDPTKLPNPLGAGRVDIRAILGDIISAGLGVLGSVTLLVFVYGGFLWLTSAGNADQVKKGSQTMVWAVVGLFLIFGSYGILGLVLKGIDAKEGKGLSGFQLKETTIPDTGPKCVSGEDKTTEKLLGLVKECSDLSAKNDCENKKINNVSICTWGEEVDEDDDEPVSMGFCSLKYTDASKFCALFSKKSECEKNNCVFK